MSVFFSQQLKTFNYPKSPLPRISTDFLPTDVGKIVAVCTDILDSRYNTAIIYDEPISGDPNNPVGYPIILGSLIAWVDNEVIVDASNIIQLKTTNEVDLSTYPFWEAFPGADGTVVCYRSDDVLKPILPNIGIVLNSALANETIYISNITRLQNNNNLSTTLPIGDTTGQILIWNNLITDWEISSASNNTITGITGLTLTTTTNGNILLSPDGTGDIIISGASLITNTNENLVLNPNGTGIIEMDANPSYNILTKNTNTILTTTEIAENHIIVIDARVGDVTITLPTSGMQTGQIYIFKMLTGGIYTAAIDPNGIEIDGSINIVSTIINYTCYKLLFNGIDWYEII